jgi:hypothetical protein
MDNPCHDQDHEQNTDHPQKGVRHLLTREQFGDFHRQPIRFMSAS